MRKTTPQAQLAMIQTALANGLERLVTQRSRGATLPESTAHQSPGALVIPETKGESGQGTRKATPLGKRRRNDEEKPIASRSNMAFRAQITREERLRRRPRPSRLLPGANRDAAARSAYSAALAESILMTLNEMEAQETANPAPSTSVSWTNCTLSVMDAQSPPSRDTSKGIDDVPPPTRVIPRITVAQHSAKPSTPTRDKTTKAVVNSPPKSAASNVETSLFTPQTVSTTPVPSEPDPKQPQHQRICGFEFTLPRSEEGTKVAAYDDDPHVRFVLSAPPSLREPPVKVTKLNVAQVHTAATPFDCISASSEAKPSEWRSTPSKPEKPNVGEEVEKADPDLKEAPSVTCTDVTVNPLARFRQLKPGQWKCPGCSVLNEATHIKCPCCEAAKPLSGAVGKVSPAVPNGPGSISLSGFSFGVATTETRKDTTKPATDSITTSGFTPSLEQKAAVFTSSFLSRGFTFGSTTSTAEGSNTTSGFTPALEQKAAVSTSSFVSRGIIFGSTTSTAEGSNTTSGFTPALEQKAAVSTSSFVSRGFTFGSTTSTAEGSNTTSGFTPALEQKAAVSTSSGFTFGSTTSTAEGSNTTSGFTPALEQKAAVSTSNGFTFGSTTSTAEGSNTTSGFTPALEQKAAVSTSNGFTFGSTTSTAEGSNTTSGFTPAIEQKAAVSTSGFVSPGFTFGSTTSTAEGSNTGKRKAQEAESLSKSSFSFGASASVTAQVFPTSNTSSVRFNATPALIQESPKGSKRAMKRLAGSFGTSDSTFEQAPSNPPQVSSNESTKASFSTSSSNFGAPRSLIATEKPKDPTPAISFGVPKEQPSHTMAAKPMETTSEKTDFTFGSSSTAPSKPFAGFGQKTEAKPCGFTFGESTANMTTPAQTVSASFTFGSNTTTPNTGNATAFGGASSACTFVFGVSTPSTSGAFGQSTASASPSTEFCFNSSSGSGSGSTAGSFGKSFPAPSAPAFTFGGASTQPLTGNASVPTPGRPAFQFGVASTAAPTVFGAAPLASSGFGSSGGFGATSSDFRSSPAPAFGDQAFGNQAPGYPLPPPTTISGAPAFGAPTQNTFGNGPPSSGFRTSNPTPAFGAAPSTAFGANNPARAFGAPAPAPGAFNVPTDGGFSMGVPPQHAKGRRILKARSRTRRTS